MRSSPPILHVDIRRESRQLTSKHVRKKTATLHSIIDTTHAWIPASRIVVAVGDTTSHKRLRKSEDYRNEETRCCTTRSV
jgi:hypothetical protein